jgi:multicomponent Na+:H+ antiporter subunit E
MTSNRRAAHFFYTAAVLTAIWYLLSGKFDLLHLGVGVVTAVVITWRYVPVEDSTGFRAGRFLRYVPWLIGQIVMSNLRVARVVLSPRMPISPSFVRKPPTVAGARALTLLGTSITLTPGTLTVDIGEDELFVHALDARSAQDVHDDVIARRIAEVFPGGSAR